MSAVRPRMDATRPDRYSMPRIVLPLAILEHAAREAATKAQKDPPMKIHIYGLFNQRGVCEYVGATRNPKQRAISHRARFGKGLELKTIRLVCLRASDKAERDTILKFKRAGQARHNAVLPGCRNKKKVSALFAGLTPFQQQILRSAMSSAGKAGSRADKAKAGRLGVLARIRNAQAAAAAK